MNKYETTFLMKNHLTKEQKNKIINTIIINILISNFTLVFTFILPSFIYYIFELYLLLYLCHFQYFDYYPLE